MTSLFQQPVLWLRPIILTFFFFDFLFSFFSTFLWSRRVIGIIYHVNTLTTTILIWLLPFSFILRQKLQVCGISLINLNLWRKLVHYKTWNRNPQGWTSNSMFLICDDGKSHEDRNVLHNNDCFWNSFHSSREIEFNNRKVLRLE